MNIRASNTTDSSQLHSHSHSDVAGPSSTRGFCFPGAFLELQVGGRKLGSKVSSAHLTDALASAIAASNAAASASRICWAMLERGQWCVRSERLDARHLLVVVNIIGFSSYQDKESELK